MRLSHGIPMLVASSLYASPGVEMPNLFLDAFSPFPQAAFHLIHGHKDRRILVPPYSFLPVALPNRGIIP
jgi:hypothetical protein